MRKGNAYSGANAVSPHASVTRHEVRRPLPQFGTMLAEALMRERKRHSRCQIHRAPIFMRRAEITAATDLGIWAMRIWPRSALELMLTVTAAFVALSALYAIKSALGLDLLPGHTPLLHDFLYPLIRRG